MLLFTSPRKVKAHARLVSSFARWLEGRGGTVERGEAKEALLAAAREAGVKIADPVRALNDLVRLGLLAGAEKGDEGQLQVLGPLDSGGSRLVTLTPLSRAVAKATVAEDVIATVLKGYMTNPIVAALLAEVREDGIREVVLDEDGIRLIAGLARRALERVARLLMEWRGDIPNPLMFVATELEKPRAGAAIVKGVLTPLDVLSGSRLVRVARKTITFKLDEARELGGLLGIKELLKVYCNENVPEEGIPLYYIARRLNKSSEVVLWTLLMASSIEPGIRILKAATYGTADMEYTMKADPSLCLAEKQDIKAGW